MAQQYELWVRFLRKISQLCQKVRSQSLIAKVSLRILSYNILNETGIIVVEYIDQTFNPTTQTSTMNSSLFIEYICSISSNK